MAVTVAPDRDDIDQIASGSRLKILGAGANTVFTLALIMIVTRGYSATTAGTFLATTALFLLIAQISEIGTEEAMLRYISALRADGRRGDVGRFVRRVLRLVVVSSVVAGLLTLAFASTIGHALADKSTDPETVTNLLRMFVPFIPVLAVGEILLAATRGFQRMGPSAAIYDVALPALQAALPLTALLVAGDSLRWLVIAWVVPYLVVLVAAGVSLRWLLQADAHEPSSGEPVAEDFWPFLIPRALAKFGQYGLRRIDVILVAAFVGPKEAAIYGAIARVITVGTVGVQAIQQVAQPKLGELFQLRERHRALDVFQTSITWLVTVSWPVFLLFALFAPTVMRVFGHGYQAGATALALLCVSQMITVATGPVDIALIMMGHSARSLVNQTIALTLDVVLCWLLVERFGLVGAAIARIVALQWNNVIPAFQVHRRVGLHPFAKSSTTAAMLALVCIGIPAGAARFGFGSNVVTFLAAAGIGGALYLFAVVRRRTTLHLDALLGSILGGRRRASAAAPVLAPAFAGAATEPAPAAPIASPSARRKRLQPSRDNILPHYKTHRGRRRSNQA